MNKKATLPSWLIALIIVVISAVLIFFLLSEVIRPDEGRIEACKKQILDRHTFKELGKRIIPLTACKAEHVCLVTSKNEECEGLKGYKDVQKITIKNKGTVLRVLADKMYDCWYMTGEGNLDYYSRPLTEWQHTYCGICAKISFSEQARAELDPINYGEFYKYLETEKNEKMDETYAKFLYNLDSMDSHREEILKKTKESDKVDIYNVNMINPDFDYAVVTAMTKGLPDAGDILDFLMDIERGPLKISVKKIKGTEDLIVLTNFKNDDLGVDYIIPSLVVYNDFDQNLPNDQVIKKIGCESFDFLP